MCAVSFGISRKTDYKIVDRYTERGLEALTDRSRRSVRYANQLPSCNFQSSGLGMRGRGNRSCQRGAANERHPEAATITTPQPPDAARRLA
jgi:hypothetical protein